MPESLAGSMHKQGRSLAKRRQKEEKAVKTQMIKSSFKALVLVVVLVGSLASAGIMQAPAPAGPIPLCPPDHPNCDETNATYGVAYAAISLALAHTSLYGL